MTWSRYFLALVFTSAMPACDPSDLATLVETIPQIESSCTLEQSRLDTCLDAYSVTTSEAAEQYCGCENDDLDRCLSGDSYRCYQRS